MKNEILACILRPDLNCTSRCGLYGENKLSLDRVENNPANRARVIQADRDSYGLLSDAWKERLIDSRIEALSEKDLDVTTCSNIKNASTQKSRMDS